MWLDVSGTFKCSSDSKLDKKVNVLILSVFFLLISNKAQYHNSESETNILENPLQLTMKRYERGLREWAHGTSKRRAACKRQ